MAHQPASLGLFGIADALRAESARLQSENDALRVEVAALREENVRLRAGAPPAVVVEDPPGSPSLASAADRTDAAEDDVSRWERARAALDAPLDALQGCLRPLTATADELLRRVSEARAAADARAEADAAITTAAELLEVATVSAARRAAVVAAAAEPAASPSRPRSARGLVSHFRSKARPGEFAAAAAAAAVADDADAVAEAEMSAKFAAQLAAARTSAAEARIAQEGARERANRACARAEAIVGTGRLSTAVVAVRDCAAAAARTGDVGSPGFKADASLGAAPPR